MLKRNNPTDKQFNKSLELLDVFFTTTPKEKIDAIFNEVDAMFSEYETYRFDLTTCDFKIVKDTPEQVPYKYHVSTEQENNFQHFARDTKD